MSKYCSVLLHLKNAQNRLRTNAKPFQREVVNKAKKVALRPNLSELEAETKQVLAEFETLTGSQARLLAKLHPLIDYYRTTWVELANMRNRLQRSYRK